MAKELVLRFHHFGLLWEALDSVRRGGDEDLSEFSSERTATYFHDYYLSSDPQRVLEANDYFGPDGKNRNQFCLRLQQTLEPFVFGDRRGRVRLVVGCQDCLCGIAYSNTHCSDEQITKDDQKFREKFLRKTSRQRRKIQKDYTILTNLGTIRDYLQKYDRIRLC